MKKTALILAIIMLVSLLSGCKTSPDEGETVLFESADEAFEAMTGAIEDGKFSDAVNYYNSGAADVDNANITDWYFYALAMKEYNEHGCIGYPLDLINKCSDFSDGKQAAVGELMMKSRNFNGIYENSGVYLYILDGKIAASVGSQLSGTVYCTGELAVADDKYYWLERTSDGVHSVQYLIEPTENGVTLTASEENTDDAFSGTYFFTSAEYPVLSY